MKIKGLRVDPSSGMASPSVKSVSVDGPGPAESSTTPTQSSDLCPFTVDCHVKHVEPLWNHDHSPTVNEIHTVVKKKKVAVDPVWQTDLDTRSGCSQRTRACCGL